MKINVIKELAESFELMELKKAEEAILNEDKPQIDVTGDDEGEQLTHVSAAIWIKEQIQNEGLDIKSAIRAYSKRVRSSLT
jgi:uncharacterized protein YajQ (UPF0234 family)